MYENERDNGLITNEGYLRLNEYVNRLTDNNIPIIFNLRHLRKILGIKKKDQDLYFGNQKNELYITFPLPKKNRGGI